MILFRRIFLQALVLFTMVGVFSSGVAAADITCVNGKITAGATNGAKYCCGASDQSPTATGIDLGCQGKGNPIMDLSFAIIRWLTNGVGLVIIGSVIYGGIQYTMSRGDPQAAALAIKRFQSTIGALFIFIFAYAILNYLIPGQVLK